MPDLLTDWNNLSQDWQIAIVSILVPLLIAFLIWGGRKLYKHLTFKPNLLVSTDNIYLDRLPPTEINDFVGREDTIQWLDKIWLKKKTSIVVLHAKGGEGKTAVIRKWLNNYAENKWKKMKRIYIWSFQNQGEVQSKFNPSSTTFIEHALKYFDNDFSDFASEYSKGVHLAKLISKRRCLLVLDGIEAFQYADDMGDHIGNDQHRGALRDRALKGLLDTLAKQSISLCLITSREPLDDHFSENNHIKNHSLEKLSESDSIQLLRHKKVKGVNRDFKEAVKEYDYHAYSLILLGDFMKGKDIRKRDIELGTEQGKKQQYQQAEAIMYAYRERLRKGNPPALALLYVISLFDDEVEQEVIDHLIQEAKSCGRFIDNLSVFNSPTTYKKALNYLQKINLLRVDQQQTQLSCHPIVKTFFHQQFKEYFPYSLSKTHRVLYDYYTAIPDKDEFKSPDEMTHLFAAVKHGCAAGRYQQTLDDIYWNRIKRKSKHYITVKLGAFSTDLALLSHFFDKPWQRPAISLTDNSAAFLLNWAASGLRALGRLEEAVEPMQASLEGLIKQKNWKESAKQATNLNELRLTQGKITVAKTIGLQSLKLADQSKNPFQHMVSLTTLANSYHQSGDVIKAKEYFEKAILLQQKHQPDYPQLYSLPSFLYYELLLTMGEWQKVRRLANQTSKWTGQQGTILLDIALNQLSLGRSNLQVIYLELLKKLPNSTIDTAQWQALTMSPEAIVIIQSDFPKALTTNQQIKKPQKIAKNCLNQAVKALRKAGTEHNLPWGLLSRICYARVATLLNESAIEQALKDLQEIYEIARYGDMKLHLTDYHLEATRLALTINQNIHNQTAQQHLDEAKTLIQQTGYHRRDGEVTYLEGLLSQ